MFTILNLESFDLCVYTRDMLYFFTHCLCYYLFDMTIALCVYEHANYRFQINLHSWSFPFSFHYFVFHFFILQLIDGVPESIPLVGWSCDLLTPCYVSHLAC